MNGFLNRQFFFLSYRHRTLHNAQFECFNQSRSGGVVVAVTTPRARCLFTVFWSSVACFSHLFFYFLCLQTLPYFSPLVNCFSAQPFLLSFFCVLVAALDHSGSIWRLFISLSLDCSFSMPNSLFEYDPITGFTEHEPLKNS